MDNTNTPALNQLRRAHRAAEKLGLQIGRRADGTGGLELIDRSYLAGDHVIAGEGYTLTYKQIIDLCKGAQEATARLMKMAGDQ